MTKDLSSGMHSVFMTLGSSNHTEKEREENDYYATEPKATELLCELETFSHYVWECACGQGHIASVLEAKGYDVKCTDLIDRGFGEAPLDFLKYEGKFDGDIITNPPYKYATEFVYKSMETITEGHKVAMLLKLQFLEGKTRRMLFEKYPPKIVYVSSSRLLCAKNGDFKAAQDGGGSAVCYCWYVWKKGFDGSPIIKWFN